MNQATSPAESQQSTSQDQQLQQLPLAYNQLVENNQYLFQELEFLHRQVTTDQTTNPSTLQSVAQQPTVDATSEIVPTATVTARTMPDFKMPSIKPITFSGSIKSKPAHELQNHLDDYLDRSLEVCQLYGFAPCLFTRTHRGQPTYVQFTASGLTEHARILWRRIPESERISMTWDHYKEWIQTTFGSLLTLTQAIEAMEKLHQSKSAT
ncbi:UNVERIFIED_CONTAM: hypothetical protein HDU68_001815, partial [Siphonaria sp. JEL0065]